MGGPAGKRRRRWPGLRPASPLLLALLAGAAPGSAGALLPDGRLWTHNSVGRVRTFGLDNDREMAGFHTRVSGRGLAFDPRDLSLWASQVGPVDGRIHHLTLAGQPLGSIPAPGGANGAGIGALDFDPEESVLWAVSYAWTIAAPGRLYKLDPADGTVLLDCPLALPIPPPIGGGNDTLTVARLPDLGGRKVLLTDGGEGNTTLFAIDPLTCQPIGAYLLPEGVTGIDYHQSTGQLFASLVDGRIASLGAAPFATVRAALAHPDADVEDITLVGPPHCRPGGPWLVECAGQTTSLRLDGRASSDDYGGPVDFHWSASCPAVSLADAGTPTPTLSFLAPACQVSCPVGLTVRDRLGLATGCGTIAEMRDTTPPQIPAGSAQLACLWPPNHAYACFRPADLGPAAAEDCNPPVAYRFAACRSDQPDDAPEGGRGGLNGDGSTRDDCRLGTGGAELCARAERCGGGPGAEGGRHYAVWVAASDACGNTGPDTAIGHLLVPHDQSPAMRDCVRGQRGGDGTTR